MEDSRRKGSCHRGPAASRMAAVGKENICPALSNKEQLNASRSPLPEGFPRAPLQDITHVISPINILSNDDVGGATEFGHCRRGHKRSKCVVEAQTSSCIIRPECEFNASATWRGLKKCVALQDGNSDLRVTGEAKLKGAATNNLVHGAENKELENAAELTSVDAEENMLICSESRGVEALKEETAEALCLAKSPKITLKGSVRSSASTFSTRASLHSTEEKLRMSTLRKFR